MDIDKRGQWCTAQNLPLCREREQVSIVAGPVVRHSTCSDVKFEVTFNIDVCVSTCRDFKPASLRFEQRHVGYATCFTMA